MTLNKQTETNARQKTTRILSCTMYLPHDTKLAAFPGLSSVFSPHTALKETKKYPQNMPRWHECFALEVSSTTQQIPFTPIACFLPKTAGKPPPLLSAKMRPEASTLAPLTRSLPWVPTSRRLTLLFSSHRFTVSVCYLNQSNRLRVTVFSLITHTVT